MLPNREIRRHDLGRHLYIYIYIYFSGSGKSHLLPGSIYTVIVPNVYEAIRNIKYEHATRRRNTHTLSHRF